MTKPRPAPEPRTVAQIPLIDAIGRHLTKLGHPTVEVRHLDAIIRAADLIVAEFARPAVRATPGMGLAAWSRCDDTGSSSIALASHLERFLGAGSSLFIGRYNTKHHPVDPADLGRCLGLLDAAPELRPHLGRMADVSPTWAALVARWGELEALYREESPGGTAPRTYELMRGIIEAVEVAVG